MTSSLSSAEKKYSFKSKNKLLFCRPTISNNQPRGFQDTGGGQYARHASPSVALSPVPVYIQIIVPDGSRQVM